MSLLGVLQFAVVVGLLNVALKSIPASRAALLFSLCPVLTLGIDALLRRQCPRMRRLAGILVALGGVSLVLGWQSIAGTVSWNWTGDGAAVLSALSAAACSLGYQPYLRRHGAMTVAVVAMPAAVLFLCVAAGVESIFTVHPQFDARAWLVVLFIGLCSGLGYLLWLWALKHASPTRVTIFLTLNPIVAAGWGGLFLGEPVGLAYGVGLICVILGVWLAYEEPQLA
jgi:drug/metabolite transporter (DMT)-like permease